MAERHHLSLSEMAARRRTHFLSTLNSFDSIGLILLLHEEMSAGVEKGEEGGEEELEAVIRADAHYYSLVYSIGIVKMGKEGLKGRRSWRSAEVRWFSLV